MKLFPLFKTLFGYAQMADEPLFPDLQFCMYDLVKLKIDKGERKVDDLNYVRPGIHKEANTMFCFPTPTKKHTVAESQISRLDFIMNNRERFIQANIEFITKLRSASNPYFPVNYPIHKCIGGQGVIIPYEDNSPIYVSFSFVDWGTCASVDLAFKNWDDITEADSKIDRLGKRGKYIE